MDIFDLIKKKAAIRKYSNKPIPKEALNRIIEAGCWGPSVHGFQPWRFFVTTSKTKINKLSKILIRTAKKKKGNIDALLESTADTIKNCQVLIAVYNSEEFTNIARRFFKLTIPDLERARIAEIEAIAASIQNMQLVSSTLGIGSCWTTVGLFCEKEINTLLNVEEGRLVAMLTLGYPKETSNRSRRKRISKIVTHI